MNHFIYDGILTIAFVVIILLIYKWLVRKFISKNNTVEVLDSEKQIKKNKNVEFIKNERFLSLLI